jgi:hypothetical protein
MARQGRRVEGNCRPLVGYVAELIACCPGQGCAGSKAAALAKHLLRGRKIRHPGLEPRRHRTASLHIQGLKPCCVQRPHKAITFTKEQGAVLPLQQHKASLGLDNEALAERLEIENNRAGEAGIARAGCDETHDANHKGNTPEAQGQERLCHRRPPRSIGENAQIDAAVTLAGAHHAAHNLSMQEEIIGTGGELDQVVGHTGFISGTNWRSIHS